MRAALRTASVLAVVGWFCVPVAAAAPLPQALTAQASPVCAQTPVSVAIGVQLTCTGYPSGSGNTLVLNADLTLGGVRTGVVAANDTIAQPNALANQHFPQTAPAPPNLIADEVVSSMANRTGAIAGVNGGFFDNDKGPVPGGSTDPFTGQPCGGVVRDGRILKSPPPGYQANLAVHADGSLSIGAVGFVGAVVHGTDVFPLASINTLGDGGPQPPCPKAFAEPTHGLGITLLTPDLGPLTLQNGANPGIHYVIDDAVLVRAHRAGLTTVVDSMTPGPFASLPQLAPNEVALLGSQSATPGTGGSWLARLSAGDLIATPYSLLDPTVTQLVTGSTVLESGGQLAPPNSFPPHGANAETIMGLSADGKHPYRSACTHRCSPQRTRRSAARSPSPTAARTRRPPRMPRSWFPPGTPCRTTAAAPYPTATSVASTSSAHHHWPRVRQPPSPPG